MNSELKNICITPKKLNVVAGLVRGKKVTDALTLLRFMNKKAAKPVYRAIKSAAANAVHNAKKIQSDLTVGSIYVTRGITLKRFRPGYRGSPSKYTHKKAHLFVTLN